MKRFYTLAETRAAEGGYQVQLDGRGVKTPLGAQQIVPTRIIADALAAEWNAQPETLDPAIFRFRDLADYAIDMVAPDSSATITKLLTFLDTDTLCYRADPDEPIFKHQIAVWEPVLTALENRHRVTLERISGIMHRAQPAETIATIREYAGRYDAFTLSELITKTSLAASLAIGLSSIEPDADITQLWAAANLEEDWQMEQWGSDAEAEAVRQKRQSDFMNAHAFGQILRT